MPDALVAVNHEGLILQANSHTEKLFGYSREELLNQPVEMLVPLALRGEHHHHRERFRQQPAVRSMGANLDLRGRRKNGSEFPLEISLSPVSTEAGILVLSAIRDISERKRIEDELRRAQEALSASKDRQLQESRSRMAMIVDSSQDAIIGKTLDGVVTHWNKGAEHVYGYTSEEMIGKSIATLAPGDRPDEIPGILEKLRGGECVDYFETVRVRKDGQRLQVSISVSPIRDSSGAIIGASAIARDVTSQRRAEQMLRQAQKMEAVGRLAGGVAHDFNNVLGIVSACCDLLRDRVSPDGVPYLDNVKEASKRGSALTRQLLTFSRRQAAVQPRLLDLNESLREVVKLLRPLMGDDVQIVVREDTDAAYIESDPAQIDQVIMNIAVNARDAMPKGGKLILETSLQEFDEALAERHRPLKAGKYVVLAISDNGIGMDAATASQIFEPFFTTKEVGKGTGLGLATVYGIVSQSGGHILVYSEPGRGTTFKIYLPAAEHKLSNSPSAENAALPPRARGEMILLVEDDSLMRTLTRQMLEEHGYRVLEASDGNAALAKLRETGAQVDAVLSDVVMPGMSGPDLASELTRLRPAAKVVFMSGYTGELMTQNGEKKREAPLLDKPFTRLSLLKTMHSALH